MPLDVKDSSKGGWWLLTQELVDPLGMEAHLGSQKPGGLDREIQSSKPARTT